MIWILLYFLVISDLPLLLDSPAFTTWASAAPGSCPAVNPGNGSPGLEPVLTFVLPGRAAEGHGWEGANGKKMVPKKKETTTLSVSATKLVTGQDSCSAQRLAYGKHRSERLFRWLMLLFKQNNQLTCHGSQQQGSSQEEVKARGLNS